MRRTKLEMAIDALKVLHLRGPLRLTHLMRHTNMNHTALKYCVDLLKQNNLVEERRNDSELAVYAITQKGIVVLKFCTERESMISSIVIKTARSKAIG